MSNVREIKLRIKSVNQTRQITKAMKLISASKLQKARQQLAGTLPFFEKVKLTMADILSHSGIVKSIYFDVRSELKGRKKAYIVLTGDKGLAGGYNNNIIKFTERQLNDNPRALLFVAGHVGRNEFLKKNYNIYKEFDFPIQNPTILRAMQTTDLILDMYKAGTIDDVYLIYTHMINSLKLEPTLLKLLPLEMKSLKKELKIIGNEERKVDEELKYEPSTGLVFDILVRKYVKGIMYGAYVEAFTSEQNARMTAMDSATANADEMIDKLTLFYNRARQAAITQEISEIVGGAAAIK